MQKGLGKLVKEQLERKIRGSASKLLGHSSAQITEKIYADRARNRASKQAASVLDELDIMRGAK